MSTTAQVKALLRDLQQDRARLQQISQLLTEQRQAMLVCHARRSEEAGEALLRLYPLLQESARRRAHILQSLKLPASGEGVQKLLSRLPSPLRQQAEHCWQSLETRMQHCQQLNERNGQLLAWQRERLSPLFTEQPHDYLYSR